MWTELCWLWTQLPPKLKGFTSPNCLMSISFPHLLPRAIYWSVFPYFCNAAHIICAIIRGLASYCRISVFRDRCRRDSLRWQEASCDSMGSHSIDGHSQTKPSSEMNCTLNTVHNIDGHSLQWEELHTTHISCSLADNAHNKMICKLDTSHDRLHTVHCLMFTAHDRPNNVHWTRKTTNSE